MKIDQNLNLVIPAETSKGRVFVHATPISQPVFENYFVPIAKTHAAIYREGLGLVGGPRIAALMLKKVATEMNEWDGPAGVESGLMAEIRRLANVVMPGERGWQTVPYYDVLNQDLFDSRDLSVIEGVLVFFTCASSMAQKEELTSITAGLTSLFGVEVTSSNSTEYANSLPT